MEKHSSNSSIWAYLASACTAIFGKLTLQDVAMWVGIITALGTFAVNWYYKDREDERAERQYGGD